MGKIYNDSHVENIDRFRKIIVQCSAFGSNYNPSNEKLTISNMNLRLDSAIQLNDDYDEAFIAAKMPINDRQDLVAELVRRVRRIKNMLLSTGASKSLKRDVKALTDKFTGDKVRKKKTKDGKPVKKRKSNSHLGIATRMETFDFLIELLRLEPCYTPNEPILKIVALDDASARLRSLTEAVDEANVHASNKKIDRDSALYLEEDGLVDVSLMCKKYVRAVFGAKSEEAKEVSAIKLKRFMRIKK